MTNESLIGVFDWLVILMMKKENKDPPQESQLFLVKREQDINHRPATIQRIRTTGKPSYRIMKPQVSQVVELGCRGFWRRHLQRW